MIYEKSLWLKSYDPGVRPEIDIEYQSLPQCFEEIRRDFGTNAAAHFLGVTFTFNQLMDYA
ncbi:MAG: hypothetical protein FJY85_06765, partial [Deltaproteobacteria bacterium]|nr:hypothetical protein [Deltaproteobacteria bacterium]